LASFQAGEIVIDGKIRVCGVGFRRIPDERQI
jgi:hypothetical protein